MEKFKELMSKCKASVHLTINDHKDSYQSVEEYLTYPNVENIEEDIGYDIYEKMKELDTIVCLTIYPDTPIGSYQIYHYDIDEAIDKALKLV